MLTLIITNRNFVQVIDETPYNRVIECRGSYRPNKPLVTTHGDCRLAPQNNTSLTSAR